MIGDKLRALILSRAAIAALVANRVYPITRPAREPGDPLLASIVYQQVSGVPERTQDGHNGLTRSRYQLTFWAAEYGACEQLARTAAAQLDNYAGVVAGVTFGGEFVENVGDVPNVATNPATPAEHAKRLDLILWHD